ncbi:MAG: hypothetical protein QOJ63_43 [Solirubrobacteraceae bacterium]|jgi:hypothetical protein|nr:hypothetical protein [Solirubrobacteraceae bacterium]
MPPIPHPPVSGRYRGRRGDYEVELRVDVDGVRPMHRISADYFRLQGAKTAYIGSMRVDEPKVSITQTRITITGRGSFSEAAGHQNVKITIPRISNSSPPAPATLRHFSGGGASGSTYVCAYESPSLRCVHLEEAREKAVTAFFSYDTASLPSSGPARSLTPASAFAEAGIETVYAAKPTVIDNSGAGANAAWSDAELHAAMERSFSRWSDSPQWAVWLLHAVTHEDPQIFGLMFDRHGLQRQGCAVFYQDLSPSNPRISRELLHVCVHELGHAFNLPHCWQSVSSKPPFPSRPDAGSWMNYAERFPGGAAAYWSRFAFEFDDIEIVHLRHAFREDVIMGGSPFAGSAAYDRSERWDSAQQDRGLRLKLLAPGALPQGVPVTVGLELSAIAREDRLVPRVLGPRPSTIDIAIRDPRGHEFVFEPLLHHCRREQPIQLHAGGAPMRDYAFIHYGKHGFVFDDPGLYRARARYTAADGSLALSDEVSIRIRTPASQAERAVMKLVSGNHQVGKLMSLMGSGASELREGNEILTTIIHRYPTHPMADIARLILGADLARGFKRLEPDGSVSRQRAPDIAGAAAIAGSVVDVAHLLRAHPAGEAPSPSVGAPMPAEVATRPGVAPAVKAFANSRRNDVGRKGLETEASEDPDAWTQTRR